MSVDSSPSTPGGSRQHRKQQTRQALLAAAHRVLEHRGLTGTTAREIAAEAGVAAGTFFVHFPDMNTLVETLLDERIGAALDEALQSLPHNNDPIDQLVHVARVLFDSYDREPELARQYLAASLFHPNPHGPAEQRLRDFQSWVTSRITTAISATTIAPIDPTLAFTSYFSLYFGLLVAGLRGQMDRARQLGLLEAALRRLLTREDQR